jgi:hypothetical protein
MRLTDVSGGAGTSCLVKNIQVNFLHIGLTMNGVLKDFLKKGAS